MADPAPPERNETLLETPHLAGALGSEQFKSFLDHVPVAIAVSELSPSERIVGQRPSGHDIACEKI